MQAMSVKVSWGAAPVAEPVAIDPATGVRDILSAPDARLDYASAKHALDRLIDPEIDNTATMATIDRLRTIARHMAGSLR